MNAHYTNGYHLCFYYYSRLGTEIFHCKGKLTNTIKPLAINVAFSFHVTTQPAFSLGFPSCQFVPRKHFYLPVRHYCYRYEPVLSLDSPCRELLVSFLTGLIGKQGPLVVGLNHPCMSCLLFALFHFP